MPAAARPHRAARQRVHDAPWRRTVALVAGVALLLAMLPSPVARAGEPELLRTPGSKQQYRQVVAAWLKGDPAGVVERMPKNGKLILDLLSPRVRGTYEKAQAKNTLKAYFEDISEVSLKDVTDPRQRMPRGIMARHYEYRYVPRGKDPAVTILLILMRYDGQGDWHLTSIRETKRRPK
jgi:hypothetical protein